MYLERTYRDETTGKIKSECVYQSDERWNEIMDEKSIEWTLWDGDYHRGLQDGCFWTK